MPTGDAYFSGHLVPSLWRSRTPIVRYKFTFRSWLDLQDVVLAFWISSLKIYKLLRNCWHRVIRLWYHNLRKTFGKFFRSYSELLSKFGSKNMCLKESLTRSSTVLVYKLRSVKDTPNFISSGSKIVKRLRRRQYDPLDREDYMSCAWPFYSLVQTFPKALHSD